MTTEFRLPNLHESIETGTVVKLLVSKGDQIEEDQAVMEIETDKAVVEVPSNVAGTVKEIHVAEGEEIEAGGLILTVDAAGDAGGEEAEADAVRIEETQEQDSADDDTESRPDDAEDTAEDTKDAAEEKDTAADREAGAAQADSADGQRPPSAAVPAEEPGDEKAPAASAPAPPQPPQGGTETNGQQPLPASPSVRRFAREIGIDLRQVEGTGPGGRISVDDVKTFSRNLRAGGTGTGAAAPATTPLPDFSKWGDAERQRMSGVRRKTAQHLGQAWATIPHVTQFDKADVTDLERLRKHYAKRAEAAGGKLTVTAILLKVVASALKVFPQFNTSVDTANNEIIFKQYCHIGLAVDTDRGLLVPVIRDVDRKNVIDISVELTQVAEKARDKKLTLDDMEGGCFTVSNLGGIGGTGFTPIVNPPEVAILGVARSAVEPVYIDGEFVPRTRLPLSLSYDHRVIDGADGARFLRWVAEAIEQPFLLSLEG